MYECWILGCGPEKVVERSSGASSHGVGRMGDVTRAADVKMNASVVLSKWIGSATPSTDCLSVSFAATVRIVK